MEAPQIQSRTWKKLRRKTSNNPTANSTATLEDMNIRDLLERLFLKNVTIPKTINEITEKREVKRRKRKTPTFNQLISPTLFSGRKDGLLKRKYKKATEMPSTEIRVITYFILFVL